MSSKVVRLGGGQGSQADTMPALGRLLEGGVDYIGCDNLAEGNLASFEQERLADETRGYARGFPAVAEYLLPRLAGRSTRIITNGGGMNPIAAGRVVVDIARRLGLDGLRVATVVGDDLHPLAERFGLTGESVFARAYLGARPLVEALSQDAQIIVTGRVADASLFVGPLVYEFGWEWDDWDRLAAGVVIGHLLECSAQVSGGVYSGAWQGVCDPLRSGFPIAEVAPDGSAVFTKPDDTSGAVTFDSVRQQLLYEVQDPGRYISPDVIADFTSVTVTEVGKDRMQVATARGYPATPTYKGLVCRAAGWLGEVRISYTWPDAEAKAQAALRFVRAAAAEAGIAIEEWHEEYHGVNGYGGPTVGSSEGYEPPEVTGRLAWRTADPESAAAVWTESSALWLSGPPGLAEVMRGREGKPYRLYSLEPVFVDKAIVDGGVRVEVAEA